MYEKCPQKLRPMDYRNVSLTKSPFKNQYDKMLEYFLAIPNDDILYGFRKRAGLAAPGNELGGWYSNDGSFDVNDFDEIFNVFGQWLSFLGRAYAISSDKRIYDKAVYLMEEWGKTIEDDGYFFYTRQCNAWHYSYEKIQGGLTDLYIYAGIKDAKTLMDKITAWAEKELPRFRMPAMSSRTMFIGGNPAIKRIDNEWYTLSENLYRIYTATGDERYKDFAAVWHYDYYWDGLREGISDVMTRVHGYSHVNNLGGAAYAYRVLGDERYLQTILNAYKFLKENQLLADGGYAIEEHMADQQGSNYQDIEHIAKSFEVPCGAWAVFKTVRHLLSLTGQAHYGEWAETALYNAIGASLPMKDDSQRRGKTFYYSDHRIGGGRKVYFPHSFPCCSGTYPQALTEYHNMIYYQDDGCLYISQYIPSKAEANIAGKSVAVEIKGSYPEEDSFSISVSCAGQMKIALRIPHWVSGGARISVNGTGVDIDISPGEWAIIDREWSAGDEVGVSFPMSLRTYPICKQQPQRAALMYGPILLASEGKHFNLEGVVTRPDKAAEKGVGITFTAKDDEGKNVLFRPLWSYKEREWYTVYHDFNA